MKDLKDLKNSNRINILYVTVRFLIEIIQTQLGENCCMNEPTEQIVTF